jgi:hypothetical protein
MLPSDIQIESALVLQGSAARYTCPYSKLRKPKKSWSFSGIQSFE